MTLARATTLITNAIFADVTNGLATTELLQNGDEDVINDYAGTGPDIPGLQPAARERVTADRIRASRTPVPSTVVPPAEDDTPPPWEPPAPAAVLASDGQVGAIRGHMKRLGYGDDDRDARLRDTARLAGRESLGSTKELTRDEAAQLIRTVAPLPDAAALAALLNDGEVPDGE
jgi:hypothetical protein